MQILLAVSRKNSLVRSWSFFTDVAYPTCVEWQTERLMKQETFLSHLVKNNIVFFLHFLQSNHLAAERLAFRLNILWLLSSNTSRNTSRLSTVSVNSYRDDNL
jgi:hypothetical protein